MVHSVIALAAKETVSPIGTDNKPRQGLQARWLLIAAMSIQGSARGHHGICASALQGTRVLGNFLGWMGY